MWFYLAVGAAIATALFTIANKKLIHDFSAVMLLWLGIVLSMPFLVPLLFIFGIPKVTPIFFLTATLSVIAYTITMVIRFKAFRLSSLSVIYPLTSMATIFTLLLAVLPPLNEIPTTTSTVGVIVTILGIYLLNFELAHKNPLSPLKALYKHKASMLILISTVFSGLIIFFDKVAIENTSPQNPVFTLIFENTIMIFGLIPFLFIGKETKLGNLKPKFNFLLLIGFAGAISYGLGIMATGLAGNIGYVSALFRTQIIFVLLFSWFFFKDKPKKEVWIGTIIALLGVALIKIGA